MKAEETEETISNEGECEGEICRGVDMNGKETRQSVFQS